MKQTTEMFYKNIGAWLRNQRQSKNKTQSEISEVIGVTFQQIQKYERATNKLNLHFFVQLCDYFKVDPNLIISNSKENLYLPEELINQGYITVSTKHVLEDNTLNMHPEYLLKKEDI